MDPVVIKRVLPCSKRQLFDAWSQPALLSRWLFASQQPTAKSTVQSSFTVGGHYEVIMHLPTGDYRHYGVYRAIERYHHIAFSWNSHIVEDSLVELHFREMSPNRCELTLTHSQFPSEEVRTKHNDGWQRCLQNLPLLWPAQNTLDITSDGSGSPN
jgi:uncharacterized protein YndB with AHSA1/START domain